jgi:FAD/FMN-containing dehydrogenase
MERMVTRQPSEATLNRLAAACGEKHVIRHPAEMDGYMLEWRGLWHGRSPLVLRPGSTEEVSRIMAIASETQTAIVPQSGNTGLVGGQIPDGGGSQVLLSLDRMTRIVDVDPAGNTMMVEAGATLKAVQEAAGAAGRFFPLSLASEGSCRIGGNLATNAGGINVLAYGNARDLCLGLEIVLADGRVLDGLNRLRKDNTGYDLRNIFIGSEGTLGIITRAVVKLFPRLRRMETAFAAVPSPQAALDLLAIARDLSGNRVVAFEVMSRSALELTVRHTGGRDPFDQTAQWYVLSEIGDCPDGTFMAILERASELGIVSDATLAQSGAQRAALWGMRESMTEAQTAEGLSIKHDISVPLAHVPQFLAEAGEAVRGVMPGAMIVAFGHLGDGNIHYNVIKPEAISDAIYIVVQSLAGSISAEHGIGQLKRDRMGSIKSVVQLELMHGFKALLDPLGILNPGKVLPQRRPSA